MRLIDADLLKDAIEKEKGDNDYMCRLCLESTKEIIDEQPTAFDVDKVVEQLDTYITKLVGRNSALYQTVMQIVKGGGVDGN